MLHPPAAVEAAGRGHGAAAAAPAKMRCGPRPTLRWQGLSRPGPASAPGAVHRGCPAGLVQLAVSAGHHRRGASLPGRRRLPGRLDPAAAPLPMLRRSEPSQLESVLLLRPGWRASAHTAALLLALLESELRAPHPAAQLLLLGGICRPQRPCVQEPIGLAVEQSTHQEVLPAFQLPLLAVHGYEGGRAVGAGAARGARAGGRRCGPPCGSQLPTTHVARLSRSEGWWWVQAEAGQPGRAAATDGNRQPSAVAQAYTQLTVAAAGVGGAPHRVAHPGRAAAAGGRGSKEGSCQQSNMRPTASSELDRPRDAARFKSVISGLCHLPGQRSGVWLGSPLGASCQRARPGHKQRLGPAPAFHPHTILYTSSAALLKQAGP